MSDFKREMEISRLVSKHLEISVTEFTKSAVAKLASHYKFSADEALEILRLHEVQVVEGKERVKTTKPKSSKREVPSIPLPYCGLIKECWCDGVRLNHGLYSQCTGMRGNGEGGRFCTTCAKQCANRDDGKPTYGVIQERDSHALKATNYGNIMQKLNITRESAESEARKFGMTIPEEQFEVKVAKKGRPKKSSTTSDTDSEVSTEPKKRGRPKKEKKVDKTK